MGRYDSAPGSTGPTWSGPLGTAGMPGPGAGHGGMVEVNGYNYTWAEVDRHLRLSGYPGPYDHGQAERMAFAQFGRGVQNWDHLSIP